MLVGKPSTPVQGSHVSSCPRREDRGGCPVFPPIIRLAIPGPPSHIPGAHEIRATSTPPSEAHPAKRPSEAPQRSTPSEALPAKRSQRSASQKSRMSPGPVPGSLTIANAAETMARCSSGSFGVPSGNPRGNGTRRVRGALTFSEISLSMDRVTVEIPFLSSSAATSPVVW